MYFSDASRSNSKANVFHLRSKSDKNIRIPAILSVVVSAERVLMGNIVKISLRIISATVALTSSCFTFDFGYYVRKRSKISSLC